MKVTTVRFSETLYAAIEEQAQREGVSAAQFIREAAILRLGQLMAERDRPTQSAETVRGA